MEIPLQTAFGTSIDLIEECQEYIRCKFSNKAYILNTIVCEDIPVTFIDRPYRNVTDDVIKNSLWTYCYGYDNKLFTEDNYSNREFKKRFNALTAGDLLELSGNVAVFIAVLDRIKQLIQIDDFINGRWFTLSLDCYSRKLLDYSKITKYNPESIWLEDCMLNKLETDRLKDYAMAKGLFTLLGTLDKHSIPGLSVADRCADNYLKLCFPWDTSITVQDKLVELVNE
jgi:hypothetical protein